MGFETIVYEKQDGVAVITLNRPERLNAINGRMSRELPEAWEDVKRDPAVIVAIVTGAGERSFCTGFDMMDAATGEADAALTARPASSAGCASRRMRAGLPRRPDARRVPG